MKKMLSVFMVLFMLFFLIPEKKVSAVATVGGASVIAGGAVVASLLVTAGVTFQVGSTMEKIGPAISGVYNDFLDYAEGLTSGASGYLEEKFNELEKMGKIPVSVLTSSSPQLGGLSIWSSFVGFLKNEVLPEIKGPASTLVPGSALVFQNFSGSLLDYSKTSNLPSVLGFPSGYVFPFQKPLNVLAEGVMASSEGTYSHGYYFGGDSNTYILIEPLNGNGAGSSAVSAVAFSLRYGPDFGSVSETGFKDSKTLTSLTDVGRNFDIGGRLGSANWLMGAARAAINFSAVPVAVRLSVEDFSYLGATAPAALAALGLNSVYFHRLPNGEEFLSKSPNFRNTPEKIDIGKFLSIFVGAVAVSDTWSIIADSWADKGEGTSTIVGGGATFGEDGVIEKEGEISIPYVPALPGIKTVDDVIGLTGAVVVPGTVATSQSIAQGKTQTLEDTITEINEIRKNEVKFSLWNVFPFCIPFDLIALITVFQAPPETPKFETQLIIPYVGEIPFSIDLSRFDPLAAVVRNLEIATFIIFLIYITRGMIKG